MDVEMKELMEQIMNQMHKITWWFMELENLEIKGISVPKNKIQNNRAIIVLFENLQKTYRSLQKKVEERLDTENQLYYADENGDMELAYLDNENSEETMNYIMDELDMYLTNAYLNLNYISTYTTEGQLIQPGIYEGTPFENLIKIEYRINKLNLDNMRQRIESKKMKNTISYTDKTYIIKELGMKKFYETYFDKAINRYMRKLKKEKDSMPREEYQENLGQICEEKYSNYYVLMNNIYNGVFQKDDDIEKFANIRKHIYAGTENLVLESMSKYEIEANVNIYTEELKEGFREDIKARIPDRKSKAKNNDKNENEKKAKKEQEHIETEEIEEER